MQKRNLFAKLDRFEGGTAVLIDNDSGATIEMPKELLPNGSVEGAILSVKLEVKDKKTLAEKEKVQKLIKKLSL